MKKIPSIPQASRTLQALSSLGYDLKSAVADIIDNSIMAGASQIDVAAKADTKWTITFLDDGEGMNRTDLSRAMNIGAQGEYQDNDLGKFGMGLKTASLSQCRLLTVISRKNKRGDLYGFQWDRDHVDKVNKWEIFELSLADIHQKLKKIGVHAKALGTVVIWERLEILDKELSKDKDTTIARNLENLQSHLRLVFHKYISGKTQDGRVVTIRFNERKLLAWDPFCIDEPNTKNVNLGKESKFFPKEHHSKDPVRIAGYVLPTQAGPDGFSTMEAWENAGGGKKNKDKGWNDLQGYYVYRADRLISYGTWLRTRNRDEHVKLARISIDFPTELDGIFRLNIQKGKLELPKSLFEHLKEKINPKVASEANKRYRKKEPEKSLRPAATSKTSHNSGQNSSSADIARDTAQRRLDNGLEGVYELCAEPGVGPNFQRVGDANPSALRKFTKKKGKMLFLFHDGKIYLAGD